MRRIVRVPAIAVWLSIPLSMPLGAQKPAWADLNARVEQLIEKKAYAEGIPLAEEALRLAESSFEPLDRRIATAAHNLAVLHSETGNDDKAEPLYRRALEIHDKAPGPRDVRIASLLSSLGGLYYNQGKYREAESHLRRAAGIHEEALGPQHPELAAALNDLAVILRALNQFLEAESIHRRALAIRERALGSDHPDVATSLNNLVVLYEDEGRYREAVPLQQRALEIRERTLGPSHPDVADSLENLAGLFELQGRYLNAESLHQRALAIREQALGPDHDDVANSLNSLATLMDRQGKYAEAEQLLQRAISIREKTLGPKHQRFAILLQNLASIYLAVQKYDDAAALHQRALNILEEALGPDHTRVAGSLHSLGALYEVQGRLQDALPLFQRSLAIREMRFGPVHPAVAVSLYSLSSVFRRTGNYALAESSLERALAIYREAMGPEDPRVATYLHGLALTHYAQGHAREASQLFQQGHELLRRQVDEQFAYMTEPERLAFLDTVADVFPAFLSFCLANRQGEPALAGQMYDFLLWKKGLIARSVASLRARIGDSKDSEALALLDNLIDARNALSNVRRAPSGDAVESRKRLEWLEQQVHSYERALVKRSTVLAREKVRLRATWRDVHRTLRHREAAVEIVSVQVHDGKELTGEVRYVALVLTANGSGPKVVELGTAESLEGPALAAYRRHVAPETFGPGTARSTSFASTLWEPLETAVAGASRIHLSPDGLLHHVSWGVLPRKDGRLLLEAHDLRIVSSTGDLLRALPSAPSSRAVLFGNPAFDSSGAIESLPGTGQEVKSIADLLRKKGWKVELFEREQALEERVKRISGPRVLHVATHGVFRPDARPNANTRSAAAGGREDPMLRSGLLFAGANRARNGTDVEDGELTAYEAIGLNLQGTELVVLSACETGLGTVRNGEGVFGLRRALEVAGAQTILMSLWNVPDLETRELMTRFYRLWLSGLEKPAALRRAQLQMRAVVKARYGRDLPYYWGAFVLTGR